MANKMLIDAAHPEETRVVVLRGNRIEEFDFEAASKRQLRGNIYLAKVTRVEPSLQAAFIEYGGNRHGFLAFAEIHPDYYQIPIADRQALLEEEARSHAAEDDEPPRQSQGRDGGSNGGGNGGGRRSRRHRRSDGPAPAQRRAAQADEALTGEALLTDEGHAADHVDARDDEHAAAGSAESGAEAPLSSHDADIDAHAGEAEPEGPDHPVEAALAAVEAESGAESEPVFADEQEFDDHGPEDVVGEPGEEVTSLENGHETKEADGAEHGEGESETHEEDAVEQLGGDALEDVPHRVSRPRRHYKIQEVIKRRQVLLVQVVKEERGNKGAALTTYLSLAGRYSVLMPNTARGGGISRKITDADDRKRLKAIAQELEVPDGMGIILRTAGAARGMPEVKRDFEYLMRMWETVRETTLRSSAPTLVYEEGSLIKRSIRDLFNKDVDEVMVSGEEAYREAKDFMRLLMPTHAKAVIRYSDPQPIFAKSGVDTQLDAMFSNQVTLRSGGYIVINQTEALVAIDVNSGRSTREHSIEDTALRTNLEAADEVARQLRLRDLAGLIVVDFIDMDEGRNDRAVERRIKDALKNDRARIQIGRISHFGLLEMSRQRMRTGVLEGSTVMCPHCAGSGTVRSMSSIALHVLRLIEDSLLKSAAYNLIVRTRSEVALYILNQKRMNLLDLESRFSVSITILADPAMTGAVYHAIERGSDATPPVIFGSHALGARAEPMVDEEDDDVEVEDDVPEGEAEGQDPTQASVLPDDASGRSQPRAAPAADDGEGGRRRRRRRRRRGRDGQNGPAGRDERSLHAEDGGEIANDEAGHDEADADQGSPDEVADGAFDQQALSDIAAGFAPPEAEPMADAATAAEAPAEIEAVASLESEEAAAVPFADEGAPLADVAGEPAAAVATETTAVAETEAPRRRRTRRTTRSAESEAPVAETAAEPVEAAPPRRARRPRTRAADAGLALDLVPPGTEPSPVTETPVAAPAAEAMSSAAPAEMRDMVPAAETSETGSDAPAAVAPEPSAASPDVEGDAESDRPKRSGWWQRAKATFTSGS